MMTPKERWEKEFIAKLLEPAPVAVVSVPVSAEDAAVIAANPESVRVSARRDDGVSVLMRPQRNPQNVTVRTDLVREVDANGRPIWDKPGGVVSDYDIYATLRRGD